MTISYSDNFGKLLLRWKGSIWKAVWRDLLVFLALYYAINIPYRIFLNPDQRATFRKLVVFCETSTGYIPLTFLLGFFVSTVVARWWEQCNSIPWPDKFMTFVTTYIKGDKYLVLRRTLARWVNLSAALCWRNLSLRTYKRFPTVEHMVQAGLMTEEELKVFNKLEAPHGKWFVPLVWTCNLLKKCHDEKVIDSVLLKELVKEVMSFRLCLVMLIVYDWVSIPLVYTQVVAIATYGYFAICLIARQLVEEPDIYVPVFTILQFLFYMGWLKVGEDLMNPYGEDDDDFEMNYILDRNIQIGYMLADEVHNQLPPLEKDVFWGQSNPQLPHTKASLKKRDNVFAGHLAGMSFNEDEMVIVEPGDDQYTADDEASLKRFQDVVRMLTKGKRPEVGTTEEEEHLRRPTAGGKEHRASSGSAEPVKPSPKWHRSPTDNA